MYLGLKTGWTFGASLFGSIFGFAILKPMSKALPTWAGGGYFGPKENVCCQSAATAAGSLGLIFTSGIPAAYQLGILSNHPKDDFGRLITFTICCAYFGMFFAIPLRKFYILKQKLTFPSAVSSPPLRLVYCPDVSRSLLLTPFDLSTPARTPRPMLERRLVP